MDPGKIFQIITNSTLLATRLLSGAGGPLQFSEPRYCLVVAEDAPPGLRVTQVTATHKDGVGVRYSITGGNRDGLFTIDQRSGLITLAAPLDYELQPKHELVVAAEAAGRTVHSMVQVTVADVNDNAPHFLQRDIQVAVVEEDDRHLPATIFKVEAVDPDKVDSAGLVYSVGGDGVDGHSPTRAFFTINPLTGHLLQLRALDRDPPLGRERWQVKVQVRDGQRVSPSLAAASRASRRPPTLSHPQHLHSHQPQVPPQAHALTTRNLGVPPQAHALTTRNLGVPPQAHALTTRNLGVPPQAHALTTRNLGVPPQAHALTTRNLGVPPDPHQDLGDAVQGQYSSPQDPSDPKDYYIPSQYLPRPTQVISEKKNENTEEWHGIPVQHNSSQWGKPKYLSISRDRLAYGIDEAETTQKHANDRLEKMEGKTGATSKFVRKKGDIVQKKMRSAERKRKLRDKNHQKTTEMSVDANLKFQKGAPASDAETRRLELYTVPPHPEHGAQVGHGKVPLTRWDGFLVPGYQHPRGAFTRVSSSLQPRASRLKHGTRKEHQPAGCHRKLLSIRGIFKQKAPSRSFSGKINVGRNKQASGFTYKPIYYINETLSFPQRTSKMAKEHAAILSDTSHHLSQRSRPTIVPNPEERSTEYFEPKLAQNAARATPGIPPTSTTVREVKSSGPDGRTRRMDIAATLTKRSADQMKHLSQRYLGRAQLEEERVYVKRLGRNGGGCEDYGSFSMSPEEAPEEEEAEPWYLQDMRREQVHVAETVVTVVVKDINDNAPVFPNATIYGEVQENGPIDLSVGVVWAWDADDEKEGTNALLTYTIEKNVMEERSGQAIFAINPETGLVRTAICCLDRETTPEYHIQVVAVDGGGLKGTGTVVVRLADVNDNSPRLTQDLWQVEVDETWGDGPPSNHTLLQVTTADHDTSNYFFYRVVEASGWGWQHFSMRTEGTSGHLYAGRTLDYEDAAQRRGFRFMVQVTDRGRGGWSDARHTDTAWVEVRLRDVNDNPPQFSRPHAHVTVREDTAPGTLLASLPAVDPDMMEEQVVEYRVVGGWGVVTVDGVGGVRLWRALDRESPGGEVGVARVVAVDDGRPSLSSTATLTITLTDVNDCPPRLLPPTVLHVTEGAPASLLGILTATDDDVWALGHGPPFTFTLAPSNPAHVLNILNISSQAGLDSGRGGAEVWTVGPLDREEHRQLRAEVVVADAGGLAATHPITIVVDDVNDNPMKPGFKTVYLWKTQTGGADAALGRVYVEDPDDWDLQDKTFAWAGPPHPLFTLQPNTGHIFASKQLREGRYELRFTVSDRVWAQQDVSANVTVAVRYLSPEALTHAVPVTLTPTTPTTLTAGWTPMSGGGGLGTLTKAVMQVVGEGAESVEVVSVYGLHSTSQSAAVSASSAAHTSPSPVPYVCVWVSVRLAGRSFMDPVKLHGLLALHLQRLEKLMKLRVVLEDTRVIEDENGKPPSSSVSTPLDTLTPHNPSSVASLASMALPLQVVDSNSTSLVTPRLRRGQDCHTHKRHEDDACTSTSCLNGGRCIRTDIGNRCVCPGGSWGPQCKVLARSFSGSGWAWVRPLPPCLPTTLSLRLLTRSPDALLLYSGPLSPTSTHPLHPPSPMVALQLVGGQPQALVEGARGPLKLQVNATLNTGTWHTLHLHLNTQGATLMVDLCGHGWTADMTTDAHCVTRASWVNTQVKDSWSNSVPIQLGGLAHSYPDAAEFGWAAGVVPQALVGCLSHLTLNGELVDVGEPAYSSGSGGGCVAQDTACRDRLISCGMRGSCIGGLATPKCDCEPGWTGPECSRPTVPTAFGQASFVKLALSFTPDPYNLVVQLRVRARGHAEGLLLQVADTQQFHALKLCVRGGVACASVSGPESTLQEACLESFPLGDGSWHTLRVSRHGPNLIISVDDGDGWRQNETLASLVSSVNLADVHPLAATLPPAPVTVDKQDGVTVGGVPEFEELRLVAVHDDLQDSCVDDVRVCGEAVPLPPAVNNTLWGQVTTLQNVEQGCSAPDSCINTTCLPPLTCHDSWRHATCSCESGEQVVGHSCQDVDECVFQPCLHGGTCYNLTPGYHCLCAPAHIGDNCEWSKLPPDSHPLTAPMAIAALTLSVLIVVVIGILLNLRLHRSRATRGVSLRTAGVEGVTSVAETPVEVQTVTSNQCSPSCKEENVFLDSLKIKLPNKQILQSPKGTKHLVTPIGPLSVASEGRKVSLMVKGSTMKASSCDVITCKENANSRRGSIAAVTTTMMDVVLEHRSSIPQTVCSETHCKAGCSTALCPFTYPAHGASSGLCQVVTSGDTGAVQPLLAQDDLRAYAYEGDGSSSGSLSSTVLGLQTELLDDDSPEPLVPEYGEVFDLLKSLPDALNSSSLTSVTDIPSLDVVSKSPKVKHGANIT
nr:putative neural-cadherin 2 isoform X2 [Procambarus clarkii]XP_045603730.1 putative neural-cadherin 2 isoform X2 [Procambarus clarkii]